MSLKNYKQPVFKINNKNKLFIYENIYTYLSEE